MQSKQHLENKFHVLIIPQIHYEIFTDMFYNTHIICRKLKVDNLLLNPLTISHSHLTSCCNSYLEEINKENRHTTH